MGRFTLSTLAATDELYQHVPRAYALCLQGRIARLTICSGRHPFYYFVPRHLVRERECKDNFGKEHDQNFAAQHSPATATANVYPPYRQAFALPSAPPFAYMFNKRNSEWNGPPVNTWRAQDVRLAYERLASAAGGRGNALAAASEAASAACYPHMVYHRSRNMVSMGTGSQQWGDDDVAAARAAGGLVLGDWLGAAAARLDREEAGDRWRASRRLALGNMAQLVLLANARLVVGVQGGMAVLAGIVGARRVLLLCKRGIE